MSKIVWDAVGQKQYESGVSKGVLFKYDAITQKWKGVAWNGLITVDEKPDGADENELWADNIKYGSLRAAEKFGGTIEAYTYPEEFEGCDGLARPAPGMIIGQQKREKFCLAYVTDIGNDQDPEAGYKIHIVYDATCTPSDKSYGTRDDNPDAITFSWDFDTTPRAVTGYKPTSLIVIDSTDFVGETEKAKLKAVEDKLYGTDDTTVEGTTTPGTDSELPSPDTLIAFLKGEAESI